MALALLAIAATPATAAPPPPPPAVVFLGDSLTAGFGLSEREAWPFLVGERLAASGRPITVVNGGVSGDTSAGGLRRLDWLLRSKPKLVVVCLGANDGLRGLPVDQLESNLREIVRKAKGAGAKVLLCGMLVPTSHGEAYGRLFGALFPRVAKSEKVPFVPFLLDGVAGNPALNLDDGVHPNPKGHAVIAERMAREVSKLLGGS